MKKSSLPGIVFGLLFIFFIQMAGTLVESIYILDLMNSKLDEKVLGVLLLFSPLLALPFYKKYPRLLAWILFAILFLSRGLTPYLGTASRVLSSGIATGAALGLFFLLLKPGLGRSGSLGLAFAVGLSTLLRTVSDGLDYSLIPAGGWLGWVLGLLLGWLLYQVDWEAKPIKARGSGPVAAPIFGIYLLLGLAWFAFSAPAVIARWTEGNYSLIVIAVSLLSLGWGWITLNQPQFIDKISPRFLILWNLLFTLALTGTLLAHRVSFPLTPEAPAVTVGTPSWLQQIPLVLMLLLFPVIFVDMQVFLNQIKQATSEPRKLAAGITLGTLAVIFLIFANIFTNVWGYIAPVSTPFRNTYWLAYLLMAGGATLLIWRAPKAGAESQPDSADQHWIWTALFGAIFLITLIGLIPATRVQVTDTGRNSLVIMTFNTQQSNDDFAERSFDAQLALIRKVSPDILALQETDSTRISLNNNDYVRYFAENLGYYSYYGPKTVTGTYGTAILSKYPLENTRTVFTYSDQDETGVAEAEIEVSGQRFSIYDVHPDGSDTAMLAFARALVERSQGKPDVIALGDFNLRDYQEAYKVINSVYTNSWASTYPTKISPDGVDMSGENRIDHIFISHDLNVRNPFYILPPASTTDHPIHWAEIYWGEP